MKPSTKGIIMKLNTVLKLFVRKGDLAKALGVLPSTVTAWAKFGKIPTPYIKKTKTALKRRKKALDNAYDEVMK